jgi:hypothetical protein
MGKWLFLESLSKHERLSRTHPMGDAAKTPFTLRQAQAERGFCGVN